MRISIKEKELFKNLIKKNFNLGISHVDSFCTDSRKIQKHDIFMPIKGHNVDSHKFIPDVIKKEASIIFSETEFNNNSIIKVNSTKKTLKKISSQWIKFFKAPIIAITGSNGKTTTKEMLNQIFSYKYKTNYTIGNYNSSVGLPVNLFNFSLDADIIILEMGANKPNEIEYLCNIAQPDYSIITNIQNAHIGNFSSINELLDTKSSIFKNTSVNGLIFQNTDDTNISRVCKKFSNKKIKYGFNNKKVDFWGEIKIIHDKIHFYINNKRILNKKLNKFMAKNMLAAYSIAYTYGINHEIIIEAFKNFDFLDGRGNQIYKNGYLLINDTYNANLESFKIGIESFMKIKCKGKKFLVIGDMKELGSKNDEYHFELGKYINIQKPTIVLGVGESIKITIDQINNNQIHCNHFTKNDKLINYLKKELNRGDAIYIKASRSMMFESIINKL